jgi:hypothetical protein
MASREEVNRIINETKEGISELHNIIDAQRRVISKMLQQKTGSFVEGWMEAREYYGTTDANDQMHGAECAQVQGPYVCTCDEEAERMEAERFGGG